MFIIGFTLHLANFVIATFIEPSLRKEHAEKVKSKGVGSESRRIFWTSFLLENLFRVGFILFSFYQITTAGSPGVAYCANQSDALTIPAAWTMNLAMAQLVFVPSFILWRVLVNFEDDTGEKPAELETQYVKPPIADLDDVEHSDDPFMDS